MEKARAGTCKRQERSIGLDGGEAARTVAVLDRECMVREALPRLDSDECAIRIVEDVRHRKKNSGGTVGQAKS